MNSTNEFRSAWGQVAREKGKRCDLAIPPVVHCKSGEDCLVTFRLDDLLDLVKGTQDGND